MNLKALLTRGFSKEKRDEAVSFLIENPEYLDELMALFFGEELMTTQYAAWVVGAIGEEKPAMLAPYLPRILKIMQQEECTDAVLRNSFKILQNQSIPEKLQAPLYDLSLKVLLNNQTAVAIKVFAMTTALKIVKENPELKNELTIVVEDLLPYGSPGIKSRGLKVLNSLEKIEPA